MNPSLNLHFIKAGLQTSVQDLGRAGHQQYGVPVGGALDRQAALTANQLVGNPPNSPLIEITLIGPKIKFSRACQIALCGADLSARLNGQAIARYQTLEVATDSLLTFGRALEGCRAYLAIGGQWQLPNWLNSASAASPNGDLLTPKSWITNGHQITITSITAISPQTLHPPPTYTTPFTIRVLPGPEFHHFSPLFIGHFFSRTHRIHPDSNRMGYRLIYTFKDFRAPLELISSAVLPGTIQITHAGQPIVLMADAQTTGGYPRLAMVLPEDLDLLAQAKPGDELNFLIL